MLPESLQKWKLVGSPPPPIISRQRNTKLPCQKLCTSHLVLIYLSTLSPLHYFLLFSIINGEPVPSHTWVWNYPSSYSQFKEELSTPLTLCHQTSTNVGWRGVMNGLAVGRGKLQQPRLQWSESVLHWFYFFFTHFVSKLELIDNYTTNTYSILCCIFCASSLNKQEKLRTPRPMFFMKSSTI